jgi:hypothetical protein
VGHSAEPHPSPWHGEGEARGRPRQAEMREVIERKSSHEKVRGHGGRGLERCSETFWSDANP